MLADSFTVSTISLLCAGYNEFELGEYMNGKK
jgi:hypothetical protein